MTATKKEWIIENEKLKTKLKSLLKKTHKISQQETLQTNYSRTKALGTVKLSELYYVRTRINLDWLIDSLTAYKRLMQTSDIDIDESGVDLAFTENSPLLFGHFSPKTKEITGVIIAPMIPDELKEDEK